MWRRTLTVLAFGLTFALALALALARISSSALALALLQARAMVSGDTAVKEARMRLRAHKMAKDARLAKQERILEEREHRREHYAIKEPLPRPPPPGARRAFGEYPMSPQLQSYRSMRSAGVSPAPTPHSRRSLSPVTSPQASHRRRSPAKPDEDASPHNDLLGMSMRVVGLSFVHDVLDWPNHPSPARLREKRLK